VERKVLCYRATALQYLSFKIAFYFISQIKRHRVTILRCRGGALLEVYRNAGLSLVETDPYTAVGAVGISDIAQIPVRNSGRLGLTLFESVGVAIPDCTFESFCVEARVLCSAVWAISTDIGQGSIRTTIVFAHFELQCATPVWRSFYNTYDFLSQVWRFYRARDIILSNENSN